MRSVFFGVLLLASSAFSQDGASEYPNRPVTLVVPYGAGGSTDITARQIAQHLGKALGQPVVVDNKPGASTTVAAAHVARATPDGYTLFIGDSATFVYNKFLYRNLRYDPLTSFDPISLIASGSMVLAAGPSIKASTIEGVISEIKANPENRSYASAGVGTPPHILMEAFLHSVNAKGVKHVPYRGEQPGVNDMIAGTVDIMFVGPRSAKSLSDAGRIRALGWAGSKRMQEMPGLPSIGEFVPGYEQRVWQAMVVPKGTPRSIVDKLNAALRTATTSQEFTNWVKGQAIGIDYSATKPEEVTRLIQLDQSRVGRVITENNISMD